jgi:carbon monoxide dehydrogenase subunit G
MRLENSFEVKAPPERAWDLLIDIPRVIPCMPGAQLEETIDESTWKASMHVKLGPIALEFEMDLARESLEESARLVRLVASARERRNRGRATATIDSTLTAVGEGTRVELVTDLTLSGIIAQYGRGMIQDISSQLVTNFAQCLEAQLEATPAEPQAATAAHAKPVAGLPLVFRALRRALARLLRIRRAS